MGSPKLRDKLRARVRLWIQCVVGIVIEMYLQTVTLVGQVVWRKAARGTGQGSRSRRRGAVIARRPICSPSSSGLRFAVPEQS